MMDEVYKQAPDYVGMHFKRHPISFRYGATRPPLDLKRGGYISVQASAFHYCTPRDDNGSWTHIEMMIFDGEGVKTPAAPASWEKYRSHDAEEPYNRIPVCMVNMWIHTIGGVKD
jgi:hypothetical protein